MSSTEDIDFFILAHRRAHLYISNAIHYAKQAYIVV